MSVLYGFVYPLVVWYTCTYQHVWAYACTLHTYTPYPYGYYPYPLGVYTP
jgi:hypothetical protein